MVERDHKPPELDDRPTSVSEEGGASAEVFEGGEELTARVVDSKAERALCRKFDLRLLPVLAVMYLFNAYVFSSLLPLPSSVGADNESSLDKGNLGNAKTNGFEKDLGFTGNQYNIILSVFYIPYVLCAPPVGMLGKKYGPSRVLPIMMFTFGSMTLLGAACKNFGGMMTGPFFWPLLRDWSWGANIVELVRVILGAAESAFFPLVGI